MSFILADSKRDRLGLFAVGLILNNPLDIPEFTCVFLEFECPDCIYLAPRPEMFYNKAMKIIPLQVLGWIPGNEWWLVKITGQIKGLHDD